MQVAIWDSDIPTEDLEPKRNFEKERVPEMFRFGDLFTLKDHVLVRRAISVVLTDCEHEAIILRFWLNQTLEEIGRTLSLSEVRVDQILNLAMKKIREFCLNQPDFSRSPTRLKVF